MNVKKSLVIVFLLIISSFLVFNSRTGEVKLLSSIFQTSFNKINSEDIKVFVINLDRTPERYEFVKEHLEKHGIIHERFSATDGFNIEIKDHQNGKRFFGRDLKSGNAQLLINGTYTISSPSGPLHYISKEIIDFNISRIGLTSGEFGCYISHRELWNKIFKENIKFALILEDDVTLTKDFATQFNALIQKLPKQWDIIYLFITQDPRKQMISIINNPILEKIAADNHNITSTVGYLINHQAAGKLYAISQKFDVAVDDMISNEINLGDISAYKTSTCFLTTPIGEKGSDSTIYEMGRPHF